MIGNKDSLEDSQKKSDPMPATVLALVSIAFRNLREHRSKTIIIGTIVALGVVILVVGNSLMDTATKGIRTAFIDNFTGDVMISGVSKGKISLFGVQSAGGIEQTPIIPEYEKVRNYVKSQRGVAMSTSQISGVASIRVEGQKDTQKRSYSFLVGVEPDTYHELFPAAKLVEGSFLEPGKTGIVISQDNLKLMRKHLEKDVGIGSSLILTSFGSRGLKIREVPIVGVFNLEQFSDGMEYISYVDVQTLRALKGMTVGNLREVELAEEDTALLTDELDFDSLFSGQADVVFETVDPETSFLDPLSALETTVEDKARLEESRKLDVGAWEYIVVKMKSPAGANRFISRTNKWFENESIQAKAGGWKEAAGPFATSADVVRNVFNFAVVLVAIIAVIIVINTLVISVVERTGEIGTMRALGAQKEFVRVLFNLEILAITLIFGLIGIAVGLLILGIIALIRFPATNTLLEILFAGPVLLPVIDIPRLLMILGIVVAVGFLANLYPLRLAMSVPPVKAMQNE
jgi:putative ABC transport system permease protein